MYQYRQILVRMRRGDSDRDIARSKTMGRKKIAQVREIAAKNGWLVREAALPDEHVMAAFLDRKEAPLPSSCVSTLEPWREQITKWRSTGVQCTTIHATLVRNHGYSGSYSSVYRFLLHIDASHTPDVPLRLEFKPKRRKLISAPAR